MHGNLEQLTPKRDRAYTTDDITAVYCIRAHADNPWVIERIRLLAGHYTPQPAVLICDFGSEPEYAAQLRSICQQEGLQYCRVDDDGVYSPAAAHNRAFEATTTELVFFCDIDTFGRGSLFAELATLATSLGMRETVDIVLAAPIFHLAQAETERILDAGRDRSAVMDRIALEYLYRGKDHEQNAFVVPYSNNFLIHRNFFSLVGGYDERFRGHGSEDFEFFLRLHYYSKHLPLPSDLVDDKFGPMHEDFYKAKNYSGFRRLFEAQSYPAEHFGIRVFHLWHPRNEGVWTDNNDWKRVTFNKVVSEYVKNGRRLLSNDFLTRPKTVLCVCKDAEHWGYFTPLRLAGYKLLPIYDESTASLADASDAIEQGTVDAFAIFNPYMKSHSAFKQLFMLAQDRGLQTIVVERGALPWTIYYDEDVAYASSNFSQAAFDAEAFDDDELSVADLYVEQLRDGRATLERMASYEGTAQRYPGLKLLSRPICFVPTQLEDDMAVTHFVGDRQSYRDFVASLPEVVRENPGILFVVKPHPLSKLADMPGQANLLIAKQDDNIHFLIDCARWVVCYNSGVGLLALLHGKPVVTIGNAFYNYDGTGHRAESFSDAVDIIKRDPPAPSPKMVRRLAAWFVLRKYSTFNASDVVREIEFRKVHGYKDILVTHFRWKGFDAPLGRIKQSSPISNRSYLWARVGLEPRPAAKPAAPKAKVVSPAPVEDWGTSRRLIHGAARMTIGLVLSRRDKQRLAESPVEFFQKAKWPPNQFFGRLLLDENQRPY